MQNIPAKGLVLLCVITFAFTSTEVDEIDTPLAQEARGEELFKQQSAMFKELATPSLYEQQKAMYKSMVSTAATEVTSPLSTPGSLRLRAVPGKVTLGMKKR